MRPIFLSFIALLASVFAQTYRCDWQVIAAGGGMLSGGDYRCGVSVAQTATGFMSNPNLMALIGFWQPEEPVTGIEEKQFEQEVFEPLITRFHQPSPNPFYLRTTLRYSLAAEQPVILQVVDRSGRVVHTMVNSVQKPGTYTISWNGTDKFGSSLPSGVYFCRFIAGSYQKTAKLLFQR